MSGHYSAKRLSSFLVLGCGLIAIAGCPTIGDNIRPLNDLTSVPTPTPTPTIIATTTPTPGPSVVVVPEDQDIPLSSTTGFIYTMIIPKGNLPAGSGVTMEGAYAVGDRFSSEALQLAPVQGRNYILGFTLDFPNSPLATGVTYVGFGRPTPDNYPEGTQTTLFHFDGTAWEQIGTFVSTDEDSAKYFWRGAGAITKAGKYALFSNPTPPPVVPSAIRFETPTSLTLGPEPPVFKSAQIYPYFLQLSALVTMSDGSYSHSATFELVSGPPGVTVSNTGYVQVATGAQDGTAIVKATAGSQSTTINLTITTEGQVEFVITQAGGPRES